MATEPMKAVKLKPLSQVRGRPQSAVRAGVTTRSAAQGIVRNGLKVRLKDEMSHEATLTMSYSWAPFCNPALYSKPNQWVELAESEIVEFDHVCCYRFQDADTLEKDMPKFINVNTLAVILISNHDTRCTVGDDVLQEQDWMVPVLVISRDDGRKVEEMLRLKPEGVQLKAMTKSESYSVPSPRSLPAGPSRSQKSQFTLKGSLESLLFAHRETVFATDDSKVYEKVMSLLLRFEQQQACSDREDMAHKALDLLLKNLDQTIQRDFPFYIGVIYRMQQNESAYKCSLFSDFTTQCTKRIEQLDPAIVADVVKRFLTRRTHEEIKVTIRGHTYTPYTLMEKSCESILEAPRSKSVLLPVLRLGRPKQSDTLYHKMFWATLMLKTRSEVQTVTVEDNVWNKYLYKGAESGTLDHNVVEQLRKGLQLGERIELSQQVCVTTEQMFDMISPDKNPNPLSITSYAIQTVSPYIHSQSDFTAAIARIRLAHKPWCTTPSKQKDYMKRVFQDDLHKAIKECMTFLDVIHDIWQSKGWSISYFLTESKEWITQFIALVDATRVHAELYYSEFLDSSFIVARMHQQHVEREGDPSPAGLSNTSASWKRLLVLHSRHT